MASPSSSSLSLFFHRFYFFPSFQFAFSSAVLSLLLFSVFSFTGSFFHHFVPFLRVCLFLSLTLSLSFSSLSSPPATTFSSFLFSRFLSPSCFISFPSLSFSFLLFPPFPTSGVFSFRYAQARYRVFPFHLSPAKNLISFTQNYPRKFNYFSHPLIFISSCTSFSHLLSRSLSLQDAV